MFSFFKKKPAPDTSRGVEDAPVADLPAPPASAADATAAPTGPPDLSPVIGETAAGPAAAPASWLSRLGRWGGILPPPEAAPERSTQPLPDSAATPLPDPASTAAPSVIPTAVPAASPAPFASPSPIAPPAPVAPPAPIETRASVEPPVSGPPPTARLAAASTASTPALASPPNAAASPDTDGRSTRASHPADGPAAPIEYPDPTLRTFGARMPDPAESPAERADADERRDWFSKLKTGLRKTGAGLTQVFVGAQFGEELYEELETALLLADAGVKATEYLIADLRRRVKRQGVREAAGVKPLLAEALADLLQGLQRPLGVGEFTPTVLMVVGVNGAGKTTTIGKLTRHLVNSRQKVMLAAADTFRAAAREQLAVWADRADLPALQAGGRVDIVSQEGGDPAGVTFDAVVAGRARGCDVVIVDTAGRLTTQPHLMEELKKMRRVVAKAQGGAPHEVLLVLDGNTGQNALMQVQAFDAALQLTGLVVTKLDGTAKGGVLAAIALWARSRSTPLAVYFIGVGEKLEDLQTFDAREFAAALLA